MILQIILWSAAVWLAFGAIATISRVGKPATPTTSGIAVVSVIVTAIIVTAIVLAALELSAR